MKVITLHLHLMVFLWASVSMAGDGVTQTVAHGEINWSNKTITATGSGAPNLKAANVAVARLGAERAAKMDAWRNILESVKGVRVSGNESAGARMDGSAQMKSKIEGVIRNFKVLDTKYYSDGGVDVIVQVPLDGVVTSTLLPEAGKTAAHTKTADASGHTGVIINAKGLKITPALAPKIVDESGKELYSAASVGTESVEKHGVVSYGKSVDKASRDSRVSGKPMILRAMKVPEAGSSDLVISNADGAKLAALGAVLNQGKVIIVTD